MNILLIAGHGAGDPGAIGNGFKEADLTRELAKLIAPKLNKYCNIDTYDYTRDCYKDSKVGKTPNWKAFDYVVELHFNSFGNSNAYGSEILIDESESAYTVEDLILKNLSNLGFYSRGVKRRNDLLNMNLCTNAGTSYALIETCFITNASDMAKYQSKKESVAEAIVNGIVTGFGLHKENIPDVSRETLYRVQVGTFKDRNNAEQLVKELESKGYDAFIKED